MIISVFRRRRKSQREYALQNNAKKIERDGQTRYVWNVPTIGSERRGNNTCDTNRLRLWRGLNSNDGFATGHQIVMWDTLTRHVDETSLDWLHFGKGSSRSKDVAAEEQS